MKKLLTIIALLASQMLFATDTDKLTKTAKAVKDTTIKAQTFKIYEGAKGGRFIIVTAKDGHQYKKYIKK